MVDTKTTEELLKLHKRWTYIRTDRNGTRYFSDCTCGRCGGRGFIDGYRYVDGGRCYECWGSGVTDHPDTVKVYTPEHAEKLEKQRAARAAKREKEAYERLCATYDERMAKAGFGKEDSEWVIYRVKGDTFSIKEELKAKGCKFKSQVGWYSPSPLEGYESQRMTSTMVLEDSYPLVEWKSAADCKAAFEVEVPEGAAAEYVGEIGERIDIEVKVDRKLVFDSRSYYGHTSACIMYIMSDAAGHCFVWTTSSYLNEGSTVKMRGTVKDHKEYKDKFGAIIKQTVLTRCKKVEDN